MYMQSHKSILAPRIALALVATALFAAPVLAADVGVSLTIGEPGFYGHIDIGGAPPPRLVYREPMVVVQSQVVVAPIYLRVRSGHAKNWKHHCSEYNACGRPVYFVEDDWYNNDYAPHYRKHHGGGGGKGKGHKQGKGHGKGH